MTPRPFFKYGEGAAVKPLTFSRNRGIIWVVGRGRYYPYIFYSQWQFILPTVLKIGKSRRQYIVLPTAENAGRKIATARNIANARQGQDAPSLSAPLIT